MTARLTSAVLVSSLIRRIGLEGGSGMVLSKGDATAGAVLLLLTMRGRLLDVRERGIMSDGSPGWIRTGPADVEDAEALAAYLEKRRRFDPDLWVVELEAADQALLSGLLDAA